VTTIRPDSFRAARTDTGVAIEFGVQADSPSAGSDAVVVTDRVELPIAVARRLLHTLEQALQAAQTGAPAQVSAAAAAGAAATAEAPAGAPAAGGVGTATDLAPGATVRGRTPVNATPDPAAEQAARLMRLVRELDVPHQYERSFRMARGELLANRFLLTMNREDIPGDPAQRTLQIGREMGMPAELEALAAQRFPEAICVHFGFETAPGGSVCKIYLERAVSAEERATAKASGQPVLVHTAYKWNVATRSHVVTRYFLHPDKELPAIRERLVEIHAGGGSGSALGIALDVLALAASRAPVERLQYIEAVEEGNPRQSFDLNLYASGLQVKDAQPLLYAMRDHFGLRPGLFQAVYDQVRHHTFGHLAGGLHRDGSEFLSVYYGVQGSTRFASGLRSR
jgi:hypothetical protein